MYYKIGIDVGGTNTDAVLVSRENQIIAKTKQTTTSNVGEGIENALREILQKVELDKNRIKQVMLGTTHCTNALVERKALNRVGVLRLALPASKAISIMSDFPEDLRTQLGRYLYLVHGGYEFDGRPVSLLDQKEIERCLAEMKDQIDSLAITGIFSKMLPDQEIQVVSWAKKILGDQVKISCSHQIGGLGLLERENATILNAALQGVAALMIDAFRSTINRLGFSPQLFIGQNDGTLMSLDQAQAFPVLTISSGPTNSIRGAGTLSKISDGLVIDVGGTTSDGGALVNFFPRESTKASQIGGVLTNFRMPDVVTIALGGGTVVRFEGGSCKLGPDSVGYRLKKQSIAFNGEKLTLSDFFLAEGRLNLKSTMPLQSLKKEISRASGMDYEVALKEVRLMIQTKIENLVDQLKTDARDIPVIVCGGGGFLLPEKIGGASTVLFPKHLEVANAIGVCMADISCEEERVISAMDQATEESKMEELVAQVKTELIKKGAKEDEIKTLIKESIPLAYLPNTLRLKVKLCGPLKSL